MSHLGYGIPQNILKYIQNCWIPTKPHENVKEITGFLPKLMKTLGKPMDFYQN